jgi:hypothetical protein
VCHLQFEEFLKKQGPFKTNGVSSYSTLSVEAYLKSNEGGEIPKCDVIFDLLQVEKDSKFNLDQISESFISLCDHIREDIALVLIDKDEYSAELDTESLIKKLENCQVANNIK